MFVRVWRFRAVPGNEAEFERFNGSNGEWAQLFARSPKYLGTVLKPVKGAPGEYETTDRWESREAWEEFRRDFAADYERLDRDAESLTSSETFVSEEDLSDKPNLGRIAVAAVGGFLYAYQFGARYELVRNSWAHLRYSAFVALWFGAMFYLLERYLMPALMHSMARRSRPRVRN